MILLSENGTHMELLWWIWIRTESLGQVIKESGAWGTTQYEYTGTGELKTITYADGRSAAYEYDKGGRMTSRKDWTGTTRYRYDELGQLLEVTDPKGETLSYTWNSSGQTESMTYPGKRGGKAAYRYDAAGSLSEVTDPLGGKTKYTYNALGQITGKEQPNGVRTTYSYDALGQLTEQRESGPQRREESSRYVYDAAGNCTQEIRDRNGQEEKRIYTYDSADQLVSVKDGAGSRSYTYDMFHNRTEKTENGKRTAYEYNDRNQLIRERTGEEERTYRYDSRGNLTQVREQGKTAEEYTFDSTNQLVKAVKDGVVSEYQYDGSGNRVQSTVTKDGIVIEKTSYVVNLVSEYQDIVGIVNELSGERTEVIYGIGVLEAVTGRKTPGEQVVYYETDRKQSIVRETDENGAVIRRNTYDEFGRRELPGEETGETDGAGGIKGTGPQFGYTGHMYEEETGLYYAKARYYDPNTGRFISEDSVIGSRNDPMKYVDPSGHYQVIIDGGGTIGKELLDYIIKFLQAIGISSGSTVFVVIGVGMLSVHVDNSNQTFIINALTSESFSMGQSTSKLLPLYDDQNLTSTVNGTFSYFKSIRQQLVDDIFYSKDKGKSKTEGQKPRKQQGNNKGGTGKSISDVYDSSGNKVGRIDKGFKVDGKTVPEHFHSNSDTTNILYYFSD